MQSESRLCEDETPSLLWGLDPVFLAFAKLYIGDILDLKESSQVPGIYFYNGHPIRQVDILGTVVAVRERDAFYSYGVDDSTGVINCICWKKLSNTESSSAISVSSARELSLTSQLKKLQETIEKRKKIEIGDIVRIRGYIHTYREEREIRATIYYKVDDPAYNIQIARMQELPTLYQRVYDRPYRSPALEKENARSNPSSLDLNSLTSLLSEKAKEFLVEKRVRAFYQQELEMEESLLSLANQPVIHSPCSEQVDFKKDTTSKAIHSIFKNAIKLLQEKGLVFQKDGDFKNLYYVTREDKELHRKIHRIVQQDCQKPNPHLSLVTVSTTTHAIDVMILCDHSLQHAFHYFQSLFRSGKRLLIPELLLLLPIALAQSEGCLFPADIEKGCHFLHILACARLSLSPGLSESVLQQVLDLLEDQSDVVSTGNRCYMAL